MHARETEAILRRMYRDADWFFEHDVVRIPERDPFEPVPEFAPLPPAPTEPDPFTVVARPYTVRLEQPPAGSNP